jgi:hypothetical protein
MYVARLLGILPIITGHCHSLGHFLNCLHVFSWAIQQEGAALEASINVLREEVTTLQSQLADAKEQVGSHYALLAFVNPVTPTSSAPTHY